MKECISWFCGAGGGSVGAAAAGACVLAGVDNEATALASHFVNVPEARPIKIDLGSLSLSLVIEILHECGIRDAATWDGVHLFTPPCQGFSVAGKMLSSDPRSELLLSAIPILTATPRSSLVLENVPAILSEAFAPLTRKFFSSLASMGRRRWSALSARRYILDCADFGLAQSRKRLILPIVPTGQVNLPPLLCRCRKTLLDVFDDFRDTDTWARQLSEREAEVLYNGNLEVCSWGDVAPTVTATQGSAARTRLHPDGRMFTNGECAALQGMGSMTFVGSARERRRQIGDSIPPPVMAECFKQWFAQN